MRPRSEGEPLLYVSCQPRVIRSIACVAKTREKRRLPGIARSLVSRLAESSRAPGESTAPGNSPEPPAFTCSRCTSARANTPAVEVRGKAAPLQALFFWGLRDTRSTIRCPDIRLRIQRFSIRRSPMNIFDMLPPSSWFDRPPKMGKFTAVRA